jgi:hypothetical protein
MESLTWIKKDVVVTYFKVLLLRSPTKANENHANFRHLAESSISCLYPKAQILNTQAHVSLFCLGF